MESRASVEFQASQGSLAFLGHQVFQDLAARRVTAATQVTVAFQGQRRQQ